jgi:transferase CAF17, mitochondrial
MRPLRPLSRGITCLRNRRLVSLTGKDAPRLLQGLITNNVETLLAENRPGFYAAFLNSHGRLLTDSFIYRIPNSQAKAERDGFFIEVDNSIVDVLFTYLTRHKLRSQATIQLVEQSKYGVWVSWTDHRQVGLNTEYDPTSEIIHLADPRVPHFASRFIIPESFNVNGESPSSLTNLPKVTEEDYKLRRNLYGITEGHAAMTEGRSLPHEFNLDVLNAIDFKKGCYVGQELTIRTQHQGVVRKRVLPTMLYSSDTSIPSELLYSSNNLPLNGEEIVLGTKLKRIASSNSETAASSRRRNGSAGNWIEGLGNVGLSLCRLEMMTDVRITADQDAMSFTQDTEFGVEQSPEPAKTIKVKAFVPEWLRHHIAPQHRQPQDADPLTDAVALS